MLAAGLLIFNPGCIATMVGLPSLGARAMSSVTVANEHLCRLSPAEVFSVLSITQSHASPFFLA